MRHTLLPLAERKVLRREYHIRTLIVLCFMLSVVGLVGIAAIFPSFIRTAIEQRTNEQAVTSFQREKSDNGLSAMEGDIARSQTILRLLDTPPLRSNMTDPIERVVLIRGPIRITSFTVSQSASSTAVVTIQGVAPTRDELLAFKSRLQAIVVGNTVDLPISALARSTDIQFSFRFIESTQ